MLRGRLVLAVGFDGEEEEVDGGREGFGAVMARCWEIYHKAEEVQGMSTSKDLLQGGCGHLAYQEARKSARQM
jgi:hypothetical protein